MPPNARYGRTKIISSQYLATAIPNSRCPNGTALSLRRPSLSTSCAHRESIRRYRHTPPSSETSISIERQWLHQALKLWHMKILKHEPLLPNTAHSVGTSAHRWNIIDAGDATSPTPCRNAMYSKSIFSPRKSPSRTRSVSPPNR
jgi:hypothetical protein